VSGFLGYFDVSEKQTTCGSCHVGKQAAWAETAHAGAYASLVNSGAEQDFCFGCHAVSEKGNAVTTAAGWNAVQDSAYQDVQCESCHGPGFDHVENPDGTQPLASIVADTGLANGCGECHEGSHHPFVEQWRESRHGSVPAQAIAARVGSFCLPCHEGKTALEQKFGETDEYIEKDDGSLQPILCAVCHDPHGSPNDAQLRAPIDVASADHLCVTCHSRRGTPPSSHGPHAAEGLLVLGENVGWIPPGLVYDTTEIISSHGTEKNPKLCVTCHVTTFTVTDAQTGEFFFESVGHLFEATACLDSLGLPTTGPCTVDQRDFRACTTSGCHSTEASARGKYGLTVARLNQLLDVIWTDSNGDAAIDATDAGLLPQVVAQGDTSQLNVADNTVTVAEGVLWNAMLAYTSDRPQFGSGEAFGIAFSGQKASGNGVHNPFLLEALLTASIDALIDEYNLAPPAGLDLSIRAAPPPGLDRR
jgi:predicted CXXCH cytochrome family protein